MGVADGSGGRKGFLDARSDAMEYRGQVRRSQRWRRREMDITFDIAREHAVDDDDVEMHVQVEAAAESLNERNRTNFCVVDADASRPTSMVLGECARKAAND